MFCSECGTQNPDTNKFCKNCGKPFKKKQQQPDPIPAPAAVTPASPHQVPAAQGPVSPKKPGATKKFVIIGAIIAVVIIAAVFLMMQPSSPTTGVTAASSTKVSEVIHGTISTGAMTPAAQGSISAAGGTITVNQPGSAINGLKFTAPPGAYPTGQQVTISSAPITGNTFGSNFNPATPMISIDAGKGYADKPVFVTIPVNIPSDQFAMAFYYDDASKKLEGIPTSSQDSKSITIATRHFSNILVSLISMSSLDGIKKVDSGFRPGVDTWEFDNLGSYISPDGYCAGDSVTMMWYYTEQRQKNGAPALNGRYDNNGREKTPLIPMDNTLGVRFASVMQEKMLWDEYWNNATSIISKVSDSNRFREFKYSILMTGEPQFVSLSEVTGGGHAIICYEVSDNTLWIADPNFPGKERMITLNGNTLGPYSSGANSEDITANGETVYPSIKYIAKSAMFSWPTLAAEYAKVQDGTIGNDQFPPYEMRIVVVSDDGTEKEVKRIPAGSNSELKRVDVEGKTIRVRVAGAATAGKSYYPDGRRVTFPITLNEGSNIIGVEGYGTVNGEYIWLGFDWINLVNTPTAKDAGVFTAYVYKFKESVINSGDQICYPDQDQFFTTNDPMCGSLMKLDYIRCGKPNESCIDYSTPTGGILKKISYINYKDKDQRLTRTIKVGYQYAYYGDSTGTLKSRENWKLIETPNYWQSSRTEVCVPNTVIGLREFGDVQYKPESGKYACQAPGSKELYYVNTI